MVTISALIQKIPEIDLKELLFSLENGRIRDKFEKGLNVDDKYSFLREFTIFGRFNHFYNNKTKSFIYKNNSRWGAVDKILYCVFKY